MEILGTPPASVVGSLNLALERATWIVESDAAAVALSQRLAHALDVAFDTGELKELPALAQRFTTLLQQLHLTVETRTQGNKEEEDNAESHRENYLRLLATPTKQPKSKTS